MPNSRVKAGAAHLRDARRQARKKGRQDRANILTRALHLLRALTTKPIVWVYPAVAAARKQWTDGTTFEVGMCLQRVRLCYGIGPRAGDAIGAWNAAKSKHRVTDPTLIPRGYPVFWSGGSHGHGHIAISAGSGFCWSTDIRRPGRWDRVPITEIHEKWGLTLLGYTGDLNGVKIQAKVGE